MTEIELFIRDEAALRGIDGQVAIDVANSEGGVEEYARHGSFNTGDSWWAYQLHFGGDEYPQFGVPGESVAGMGNTFSSFTGWAPGDPDAWRDAARYALNTAKRDGWGAWYGAASIGITGYDGIDQSVAWDPNSQTWDYETMGGGTVPEEPLPVFDPSFPAFAQNDDWSCAPTSTRWGLWAYGRQPTEQWLESSMLSSGVVTKQHGLSDATGAGLADWINREYGEFGYLGSNDPSVTFADVATEAAAQRHPLMMGGRAWYHWTGVRGYDATNNRLLLANPASGWMGITQTMSPEQFRSLGPFSMVRLTHPEAEGSYVPVPKPPDGDPFGPWRATVGSGLLEMMGQDGTRPAQRGSTWLPLGVTPADVETCYGENGTGYVWLLTTNAGYRFRPS